ncbi:V-set and transmembrane domain-containing protein 4a isoform X1 [Periophthalmus magnuspinnatus]|uniref:V-set and transmembrane domain-containing protein 4a isoform X1 n=1 Tax=Periophthalmus magnuspinnatus TaxID=409849 RepID=UPI00145AD547|nr:V-set and transmembrane domain-containing protein 4a isoform X1 [Periophthalmus magnuspinnatus]
MYLSIVAFVLTKALLSAEVCHALNVTVTPGPVVMVTEKDNLTLSCLVSQRKRSNSVLILRWFYSPPVSPTTIPKDSSPHPSTQEPNQFLIAKLGIKKIKLYGNYTRRFPKPKFRLFEEQEGELFRLWILNVSGMDQGLYSCKVQEIRKLRNTWRSSSNGTGSTQLMVHFTHEDSRGEGLGQWSADVYLGAVLICCLGLLSIFFFTLVLSCQYFYRRHRLKNSYLLVKCPESSSGETVTSSSSSSSSSPKALRKDTRPTIPARTITPPTLPREPPPHTPNKVPVAAKRPQKPKRSKLLQQRAANEDSLTYAELELVRPRPHPSALSSADPAPSDSDTVYAQILFQEKQL